MRRLRPISKSCGLGLLEWRNGKPLRKPTFKIWKRGYATYLHLQPHLLNPFHPCKRDIQMQRAGLNKCQLYRGARRSGIERRRSFVGPSASAKDAETRIENRELEIKELQQRLAYMRGDEAGWRSDLETRENKLRALEAQWQAKRGAGNDNESPTDVTPHGSSAKSSLKGDEDAVVTVDHEAPLIYGESIADADLRSYLRELQENHTATLADLSAVSAKYQDALLEISDLAAQLKEYQLQQPSLRTSVAGATIEPESTMKLRRSSSTRKASEEPISDSTLSSPIATNRRGFFKQAASTESLRAR